MKNTVEHAKTILKEYWGFDDFKGEQAKIVQSILQKNDTLALMPTGGGKSICFQVPGLCFGGLTLVISPLIALMQDQVMQLNQRNIKAISISAANSARDIDRLLDNCIYGNISFLYVSPERLSNELFLTRLAKMPIKLIAVDEAHCISQWGYDFRPAYLSINAIRPLLPAVPIIALTASATQEVQLDICQQLEFDKNHQVVTQSFARKNLAYVCFECETKEKRLIDMLEKLPGSAVVYVRNRKQTKQLSEFLQKRNISADFYHAGLTSEHRSSKQTAWINNRVRVMVATNAFGMGIDKPDVKLVVHMDVPESPEAYFQEAGRAGRDGNKAYAVLLYQKKDLVRLQEQFLAKYPDKEELNELYQKICSIMQIAHGDMPEQPLSFSIAALARKIDIPVAVFLKQTKTLEWCGFLSVVIKGSPHSQITWLSDVRQAQHKSEKSPLLALLIRSHGDFFENTINIQEKKIAKTLGIDIDQVISQLNNLHHMGWLTYQSASNNAQLTLLQARVPAAQFAVPAFLYRTLKKQDENRLKFILSYVKNPVCRSKQLLTYFDENNLDDCGKCDVCTNYGHEISTDFKQKFSVIIQAILEKETMQKPELVQRFNPSDQKAIKTLIRLLLDEQIITLNNQSQLCWTKQ